MLAAGFLSELRKRQSFGFAESSGSKLGTRGRREEWGELEWRQEGAFYSRGAGAPREVCTASMASPSTAIGRGGSAGVPLGASARGAEGSGGGACAGGGVVARNSWWGTDVSKVLDEMSTP